MIKGIFKLLIYFICIILFLKVPYNNIAVLGSCLGTMFMCLAVYNYILDIFYSKHKETILKYTAKDAPKTFDFIIANKICAIVANRYRKPIVIACMGFIAYFIVAMKYVVVTFPV